MQSNCSGKSTTSTTSEAMRRTSSSGSVQSVHSETSTASSEKWTKEEKFQLYSALKTYGSHNLVAVQKAIPTKNIQQVEKAINEYKTRAFKQPGGMLEGKRKLQSQRNSRIPLLSWAQLLTDNSSFEELRTDTATALRFIALFENIPPSICTENIDFRLIYHTMANAMEGKALQEDGISALVLDKCLTEAALVSKSFIKNATLLCIMENYFKSLKTNHKELNKFPKPDYKPGEQALLHLATKPNYNPFCIGHSDLTLD